MNKLQKRELRKKRHKRQEYLKREAPLDRMERTLLSLNPPRCGALKDSVRCMKEKWHEEPTHEGRNANGLPVFWRFDL